MTGSIGALNLLDGLHVLRQPDTRKQTMPVRLSVRLSAENAPLHVCFISELASVSSAVFCALLRIRVPLGSFGLISARFGPISARFGPWFPSDLERWGWRIEETRPPVFPSSVHPLRTSRAAVRKESVWLCCFSRGYESRGPDMADDVP